MDAAAKKKLDRVYQIICCLLGAYKDDPTSGEYMELKEASDILEGLM